MPWKAREAEEAGSTIDDANDNFQVERRTSPLASSLHSTPRQAPSPQSSDAENQPPSSRPSQTRPPLSFESPMRSQEVRIPLATITTPLASPSKRNNARLQSTLPWTSMDIDHILHGTPHAEEENQLSGDGLDMLTNSEKRLTVEEWIKRNAERGEEKTAQ